MSKALTLTQPWATLVALGQKRIETRSWRTWYRGPLYIHASRRYPRSAQQLATTEPFRSALRLGGSGQYAYPELRLGQLVALVELLDCVPVERVEDVALIVDATGSVPPSLCRPDGSDAWQGALTPGSFYRRERHFGDYTPGRFAWILGNIQPFHVPGAVIRGHLGLWNIDVQL